MTKIEITDEIVTRFLNNMMGPFFGDGARERTKATLDAALNPPPEPEIEVTAEMAIAGIRAVGWFDCGSHKTMACMIYRAMRALEPKPKADIQDDPRWPFHQRAGDAPQYWSHRRGPEQKPIAADDSRTIFTARGLARMHCRKSDTGRNTNFHRRAGDPK